MHDSKDMVSQLLIEDLKSPLGICKLFKRMSLSCVDFTEDRVSLMQIHSLNGRVESSGVNKL